MHSCLLLLKYHISNSNQHPSVMPSPASTLRHLSKIGDFTVGSTGRLTLLIFPVKLIIWLHGYIGPLSMMIWSLVLRLSFLSACYFNHSFLLISYVLGQQFTFPLQCLSIQLFTFYHLLKCHWFFPNHISMWSCLVCLSFHKTVVSHHCFSWVKFWVSYLSYVEPLCLLLEWAWMGSRLFMSPKHRAFRMGSLKRNMRVLSHLMSCLFIVYHWFVCFESLILLIQQ
jgi:hypothetical protein